MHIIPRDWQADVFDKVITSQNKSLIVNAPTGAGKMVFIMLLAQHYQQFNNPILILVDRIALIKQLSECATRYGIEHNIIQANNSIDNQALITIASVQSYDYTLPPPEYLLIDECHSIYENVSNLIKQVPRSIGFTATAITKGLGLVYGSVINATTAQQLTSKGVITPFNVLYMSKINMINAKMVAGEYSASEVHKRSAKIYGDVVAMYQLYTPSQRGIVFCANKAHCEDVAALFIAAGIPVGVYTSSTKESERIEMLRKFDNDEIKLLISVSALSKGFDKGYIEVIMDLRPLRRSLAEYIQMIGRGLRQYPGKTNCTVLDFSGNWERFAADYENIFVYGVPEDLNSDIMGFNRARSDYESDTIHCPCCGSKIAHSCIKCGYKRYPRIGVTTEVKDIIAVPLPRLDIPTPPPVSKISAWDKFKQFFGVNHGAK